jgi:hypothetical protein
MRIWRNKEKGLEETKEEDIGKKKGKRRRR